MNKGISFVFSMQRKAMTSQQCNWSVATLCTILMILQEQYQHSMTFAKLEISDPDLEFSELPFHSPPYA